jgi:5-methylcytosine-specific restriction enzyme subunit McrC
MLFAALYSLFTTAKWKNMAMQANDLDREDFFQIHTYLSYFQNHKDYELVGGGLFYPLAEDAGCKPAHYLNNNQIPFVIEGIKFHPDDKKEMSTYYDKMKISETAFIKRMKGHFD